MGFPVGKATKDDRLYRISPTVVQDIVANFAMKEKKKRVSNDGIIPGKI
jgi:hypothetical protein